MLSSVNANTRTSGDRKGGHLMMAYPMGIPFYTFSGHTHYIVSYCRENETIDSRPMFSILEDLLGRDAFCLYKLHFDNHLDVYLTTIIQNHLSAS